MKVVDKMDTQLLLFQFYNILTETSRRLWLKGDLKGTDHGARLACTNNIVYC